MKTLKSTDEFDDVNDKKIKHSTFRNMKSEFKCSLGSPQQKLETIRKAIEDIQ
jgi:hypothetical protein